MTVKSNKNRARPHLEQGHSIRQKVSSRWLIFPGFVAQGRAIEFRAVVLPEGHEAVHEDDEPLVVVTFEQVYHFVYDEVEIYKRKW